MTIEELGQQIKTKHPEYASFPDAVVANRVLVKYPEYQSHIDSPVSTNSPISMTKAVMDVLPNIAPSPVERIQKGLNSAGESLTEALGKRGHPVLGALYGTEVQTLPQILGAATSLGALETSPSTFAKAIRNTPEMLGPQYAAQNEIAGISQELPVRAGRLPNFPKSSADVGDIQTAKNISLNPPVSYPKENAGFLNFVRNRIDAYGKELTNQELNDYDKLLNGLFKVGKTRLESQAGEGAYAVVSDLKSKVHGLLSSGVTDAVNKTPYWPEGFEPSRESLDEVYALSKKLRVAPEIAKKIWSYIGPKVRVGAGALLGQ